MQAQQTPDVAWHTGRTAVQKRAYLWSEGHVTAVIAPFGVHPQNVRLQNVRFQNVRFQNVWNVRFTKRQVYKTSGLLNVRSSKRQVFKTSGCKKNIHIYSVLVVGGNPQVLLQPCLQAVF